MTDRDELQQLARQVDRDRSRLEEIQHQIERVNSIQSEHIGTQDVLEALENPNASGHVPVGAGILIPFSTEDRVLVDLGSGLYGERAPNQAKEIISQRQGELIELLEKLQTEGQLLSDRIEKTTETFTQLAQVEEPTEPPTPETQKDTQPTTKKRRKGFGSELTLDD